MIGLAAGVAAVGIAAAVNCRTAARRPPGQSTPAVSDNLHADRASTPRTAPPAYRSLAADEPARLDDRDKPLRPENHQVAWLERHGPVAKASSSQCMSCHQEEDCASCHTDNLSEPSTVHPPNFEIVHAADARLDGSNCTDCHGAETFCASCHVRTRTSAIEPNDPPTRSQFHPPGWLNRANPNNHGVVARRNITECASCHQEDDCVSCHQGINPHPPEFQLNCGRWLRANPRPCAKCHTDIDSLRTRCL